MELDPVAFPWIVLAAKVGITIAIAIHIPPVMIWLERRAPALMQRRRGPNRVGLFRWRLLGLLQTLADAIKLIFKEETVPARSAKFLFHAAPIFSVIPAFLVICAIPFGNDLMLDGQRVATQAINLEPGFLFILAISSLGVYGITIAGWAAGNKYSLLGSLRASAQMISYEIPMGLALIPVVLIYDSLTLSEITVAQSSFFKWGVFAAPLSFFIFLIAMFAETNRAPFDLPESESELIAGFHTEFGSTKFALFYLAEYINMFSLSLLCAHFFLGGWQIPGISFNELVYLMPHHNWAVLLGTVALMIKAAFFMWLYVWVRWTVPRFRYDQLMSMGWKFLLPAGLANIAATAVVLAVGFF